MTIRQHSIIRRFCTAAVLAGLSGCGTQSKPVAQSTPAPAPSATPFPLTVAVSGGQAQLFDAKGRVIALVSAENALVGPNGKKGGTTGMATGGKATLYQNGKPAATLSADKLNSDSKARTVVGVGNVSVQSLAQADAPAIRADTMTWQYDQNKIVGSGNVLITRKPDMQMPGSCFEADTAIHEFRLMGNDAPATGSF